MSDGAEEYTMKYEMKSKKQLIEELADMRRQVAEFKALDKTHELEMEEFRKSYAFASAIFDTADALLVVFDPRGRIVSFNKACTRTSGYTIDEVKGKVLWDVLLVPEEVEEVKMNFDLMAAGISVKNCEYGWVTKNGNRRLMEWSNTLLFNEDEMVEYIVSFGMDITERKHTEESLMASLKEKEVLLKEIHHRVKNNLQVIKSLLSLQSLYTKDEHTFNVVREAQNRVYSMALVHEEAYKSQDLTKIDFTKYIESLARNLRSSYKVDPSRIKLKVMVKDVSLGIDLAVPCGLIMNELLSNVFKHAFPTSWEGKCKVSVTLHRTDDRQIELIVQDNGVGMPEDLNIKNVASLGLKLVIILTEDQLQGKVRLNRRKGTRFIITFPG